MASVNKVILVGNLGRDPEVRYTPDGAAICSISVATTSQWKDRRTGERREETEWHRVVFYNRLAEIAGEYLKKGRAVYIEGRTKTRKWQDKQTGQDRYSTEVIGDQLQMLGGRDDVQPNAGSAAATTQAPATAPTPAPAAAQSGQAPATTLADMDDDIPF